MAIYHLCVKTISRSKGQSATAGGAYRAGDYIKDERTGEIHDYRKKGGVYYSEIITPNGDKIERAELWNLAEQNETRKNSTVAREFEVALPSELNQEERKNLAKDFAMHLSSTYKIAVDLSIHEPSKQGNEKNFHAHILTTTREFTSEGLGKKTRVLDEIKLNEVEKIREVWANFANSALEKANSKERIDHRSLKNQGIDRKPTQHMGKTATAIERKGEIPKRTRNKIELPDGEQVADQNRHTQRQDEVKNPYKENINQGINSIKSSFKAHKEQERARAQAEQERIEQIRQAKQEQARQARAEQERQREIQRERERQERAEREKNQPKRQQSRGMER